MSAALSTNPKSTYLGGLKMNGLPLDSGFLSSTDQTLRERHFWPDTGMRTSSEPSGVVLRRESMMLCAASFGLGMK